MTWFETLTGFSETSAKEVRAQLRLDGTRLTSMANKRTMNAGEFTTPSLSELRESIEIPTGPERRIRIAEVIGDVQALHQNPENKHAVFQVASQFNCLEMASPHIIPEDGIGIYQNDWTQGPACCISAGAGTIFRNYFVELNGQAGQTSENQIDCLAEIACHFDNSNQQLWQMQNGYCFPTAAGLRKIEQQLSQLAESQLNQIRGKLRVGVQSNTEVTIGSSNHGVTQVFCSALPIAYSGIARELWNHFPRLILDATYESTFYVARKKMIETGCNKLFLTLVGGGVFGNSLDWILSSIERSMELFACVNLDVKVVSYGASNREVASLVDRYSAIRVEKFKE